jgi:hypothetical protein
VIVPPTTGFGAKLTSDTTGANTVRVAVLVTPFAEPEMVTARLAGTGLVVMMKFGEAVAPAGTVTEAGMVTLGSLLESVTTMPPVGAAPVSVIEFIPVIPEPPSTDVGESTTADIAATLPDVTVKVAVRMPL